MVGAVVKVARAVNGKQKRPKMKRNFGLPVKIVFGVILLVSAIMLIVMLNTDSPDYLNMAAYTYRTYSVKHTYQVLQTEKELSEARDAVADMNKKDIDLSKIHLADSKEHVLIPQGSMSQEYCDIQNTLLQYCNGVLEDEGISYNIELSNGRVIEMDALLFMTMCNAESGGWMTKLDTCISSIYPVNLMTEDKNTKLTKENCLEKFASFDTMVLLADAGSCTTNKPIACDSAMGYTERGPATQRFPDGAFNGIRNVPTLDEQSRVGTEEIKRLVLSRGRYTEEEWNRAMTRNTGNNVEGNGNGDVGDRFNIHDQLCAFYNGQISTIRNNKWCLIDTDKANRYTVAGLLRLAHWTPAAIMNGPDAKSAYMVRMANFITTNEECLSILQEEATKVANDICVFNVKGIGGGWASHEEVAAKLIAVEGFPDGYDQYISWLHELGIYYTGGDDTRRRDVCEIAGFVIQYMALEQLFTAGGTT